MHEMKPSAPTILLVEDSEDDAFIMKKALAKSRIGQVSVEVIHSHVPMKLLGLLDGKDVLAGVIDVATDKVETPDEIAAVIKDVMQFVPKDRIVACTNCGMAPMRRDIAEAKLKALGAGAKLARERFG